MNKLPKARREQLVVQELADEVLVYDLDRDKAHCLNQTAALVWKQCDGESDVAQIAARVGSELRAPVDERMVWFALGQLGRDKLLEESIVAPAALAGMTRRQMVRTLGLAAVVAVPVITSIVAPTTAQAVSCFPNGQACVGSAECCSGLCSGGICGSSSPLIDRLGQRRVPGRSVSRLRQRHQGVVAGVFYYSPTAVHFASCHNNLN